MTIPIIKLDNLIHYIQYIHQHLRKSSMSSLKKYRFIYMPEVDENIFKRSSLTTVIPLVLMTRHI